MSARRLSADTGGYYGVDKLAGRQFGDYDSKEEEFLRNASAYDDDSDEEPSSGDEDDMCDFDELFSEEAPPLDDQDRYLNLREPLYVSAGAESSLSNPNGAPMASMGGGQPGKLPFNRRKIRYFDIVTANDSAVARAYVQKELRRSKMRAALVLSRHLRKVQNEERRRRRLERGEPVDDLKDDLETPEEKALLNGSVEPFEGPMKPSTAAALILESLAANPAESVEGMAKCYDGVVAAGVALLDSDSVDPTSLSNTESKARPSRSEVMAALAPLLITSLEQPAGEVILMLAKLRRMCATPRYQRRFVQRVAACLIRPPRGAIWCLKHQNDMEAILVAAELIFDSAFDIFSKGWHERGRLLLADTRRAATLNSAAQQLRNLSSEQSDGLALGGLHGHGNRRRLMATATRKGDGSRGKSDSLAEWEVIAVDRQIRVSISNVLSQDWSRTAIHSDIPRPHNRRATVTGAMKRSYSVGHTPSSEMSPKSMSSPRSPSRSMYKTPQSPPYMPSTSTSESMDNIFGPSFSNQFGSAPDRALTPPPPNLLPSTPPAVQRSSSKEMEGKAPMTPPRSPKSPTRPPISADVRTAEPPPPALAPLSPKRGKFAKETVGSTTPTQMLTTPLSPSASSVGTTGSGEIVTYKPTLSSANSASAAGAAAHYRMLTSTAAERKRTVAACRALRAQIQRFEDAFIQLHGRPPKGAAERAPLATTYAQYREWKRAIRADAACRIQALFRGASTRWRLLRTNNPDVTRVIMKRAGRSKDSENIINQISIPVEIGQQDQDRSTSSSMGPPSSPTGHNQLLAPQWASRVVRRRSGDRENLPTASSPRPYPPTLSPAPSSSSDFSTMSLADLQARKRDLKQQLKQYDMNFARRHGRMPVKAEKEPIRHLYESYNSLKNQISVMEQEARQQPAVHSPVSNQAPIPPRTSSPTGSESGHSGSDDSPLRSVSALPSRSNRRLPRAASPPLAAQAPATAASLPTQDLAALKAEKTQLHQMLRSYEKDFYREHKRQVSSFADIRPVASQYRRYKEIKKAIAAIQTGD